MNIRKVFGIICFIAGLPIGVLAMSYILNDIYLIVQKAAGQVQPIEGPGLGIGIGGGMLLVLSLPFMLLGFLLFTYNPNRSE